MVELILYFWSKKGMKNLKTFLKSAKFKVWEKYKSLEKYKMNYYGQEFFISIFNFFEKFSEALNSWT